MNERRYHYYGPSTGEDSEKAFDEAVAALARTRAMGWAGDAGVDLHLLTSLMAEAQGRLAGAVADARRQKYSWAEIADLLGVTRASAWQRYSARAEEKAES
jgi:hypothetical protein